MILLRAELCGALRWRRVRFHPLADLFAGLRLVGIVVVATEKEDFEVGCLAQTRDLVAPPFDWGEWCRIFPFLTVAIVARFSEGLRAETVVAAGGGVGGFDARQFGAACRGGGARVGGWDEVDVERAD